MEFIEFPVFIELIDEYLSEDERREMQNFLLENPEAGDVIRGGGGIRKMRWKLGKRGKSGGIRIIYYFKPSNNSIYFLLAYSKSELSNLSEHQTKTFARFVKEYL